MRIHGNEIYSFLLGAGLSWLATFLSLTRDRRLIANIKRDVRSLAAFHNLDQGQYRRTEYPTADLVSDKEYLDAYLRALRMLRTKTTPPLRLNPTLLTAEIIICEKLLGLSSVHAVRVLMRTKDFMNLEKNLRDVSDEIAKPSSN